MSEALGAPQTAPRLAIGTSFSSAALAALPGALGCALIVGAAFANGGYFAGSWGWLTLASAWAAGLTLLLTARVSISRTGVVWLGAWTAFCAWIALSGIWSISPTLTSLEAERDIVYLAAALASLVLAARSPGGLVRGVWAAITIVSGYSLLTRLLPQQLGVFDATAGNRLTEPIGYWNSLGLFAAMGLLLAFGLVSHDRHRISRILAAASTVPLAGTLYFTFSRGGWLALGIGAIAMLGIDWRRLQLLLAICLIAPWAALTVLVSSRSSALTSSTDTLAAMSHDGHRVLLMALLMTIVAGAAGLAFTVIEGRVHPLPEARRLTGAILLGATAVVVLAGFVRYGSPITLTERGWHDFSHAPTSTSGSTNLNSRLFHLYGSGRVAQWRVAWRETKAHPVLGSGAGTYEVYWNRYRTSSGQIRNVHNLYLETLATVGPPGLLLLAATLALPFAALRRRRTTPFVAGVLGAYAAYLAHAIVDWDWQITSVTLVPVLLGATLLTHRDQNAGAITNQARTWLIVASVMLGVASIYTIAEQLALSRAATDAAHGKWSAAEHSTNRAAELAPWSSQPWQALGEAQLGARQFSAARVSIYKALGKDKRDWSLWYDLAKLTNGRTRVNAMNHALALNPRSPEMAAFQQQLASLSKLDGSP